MKKICIITNIPSPYRVDFFNYLNSNKNYDFKIIYSSVGEDDRGWKLDKDSIKNSIFLKSKSIVLKKNLDNKHIHLSLDIIKYLNKYNPDVVIGCEYNPIAIISYYWSKLNNKKYISWSDGTLNSEKNINFMQKFLRKKICKNAKALIASSSKTREAQLKYGANEENIFISYLTVNIDKFLFKKKEFNNKNILFVGRLSKRKGLELAFNSLKLVKNEYKLTIVGDGPQKDELVKKVNELGLAGNVEFKGSLNGQELLEEYRRADCFIIPSYVDCFGLVISEAMCNSLPIIASKYVDGSYDLIESEHNGYIVDPENYQEFADAMQKVLASKDIVKVMGEKSYQKIQKFKFEEVSKGIFEAIEKI